MNDVLGEALKDYQQGNRRYRLYIYNKYGSKEVMPVSTYFRGSKQMTELELLALEACTGKILDIGAAAGSHALLLQQKGMDVTAMDLSAGASAVMKQRDVNKIISTDIFTYKQQKFNTLLLLMNGIGLAGTLAGLRKLLQSLKHLLHPKGQVLFDSSDVSYLYQDEVLPEHYYGEIDYEYAYRGQHSGWFKWLYIDQQTMSAIAIEAGFQMELLFEDAHQQYLARLTKL